MRKDAPKVAIFRTQLVRKDQIILDDISIEIEARSWTEIVGISGAGKSDIFSYLCLRKQPKQGQVLFDGMNVEKMDRDSTSAARLEISSCSQRPLFLERESIFQNLRLPLFLRGISEADIKDEVLKAVDAFECVHDLNLKLSALDPDDRLMVALMRTLVGNPSLIVIDALLNRLSQRRKEIALKQLAFAQAAGATIVLLGRQKCEIPGELNVNALVHRLDRKGLHAQTLSNVAKMPSIRGRSAA